MPVRLAAIDLDGTLLRSDGTLSTRTCSAARTAVAAGVEIVIVTARGPRAVADIALELGVRGEAICSNRAILLDLATSRACSKRLPSAASSRRSPRSAAS